MPDGIADGLAYHRLGVIGHHGLHHRERSDEGDGGAHPRPAETVDGFGDALPQSGGPGGATVQIEDRGADVADHVLQFVDGVGQSLLDLGDHRPCGRPLQRQAHREQSLDHMVVQIPGDPVAFGQHIEFAHLALSVGQLPGQRRLIGEGGRHGQLILGEASAATVAEHHDHTGDGVASGSGDISGRPQWQEHGRTGWVDRHRQARGVIQAAWVPVGEDGPDQVVAQRDR